MSKYPINLALRFLLEVLGLSTYGVWGYQQSDTWTRILLAIILPLGYAVLWGVFAVKDDPSRSGKTVVQTPGTIRLILELLLFGAAAWMMHSLGYPGLGFIFGGVVTLHYILSYDRIAWLLKQK